MSYPAATVPGVEGDLRLTGAVRAVLSVLCAARGQQMPVASIARDARLSAGAVRVAVAMLEKAGLVQHVLAAGFDRQPPRTVYWPTHDGYTVGAALRRPAG